MSDWIEVGPLASLPPGSRKVVDAGEFDILIVNADGIIYAVIDECSHQDLPVSDGSIDGDIITCPFHNAEFCLADGEALSAPAFEPIECFDVETRDGMIRVATQPRE